MRSWRGVCDEEQDDLDRHFDWFGAFEAGKRDRYTGDPADTCTCPGCVDG